MKARQLDIMQTLAKMLEARGPVKVTTASLAKECRITEAAIYRHFPSKRKIYEGLVDFCEQNIMELIGNAGSDKKSPLDNVKKILVILVSFAEKNPGLARLLTREAFSIDESTLDERIKQMFSKIELQIKQNIQKHEQSTKSKLILPCFTIKSVTPLTPLYKTSSAILNASVKVVSLFAILKRF